MEFWLVMSRSIFLFSVGYCLILVDLDEQEGLPMVRTFPALPKPACIASGFRCLIGVSMHIFSVLPGLCNIFMVQPANVMEK